MLIFFKEIISNNQKWKEYEVVMLTKEYSAILEKKLAP